jgi:hypothetical protein
MPPERLLSTSACGPANGWGADLDEIATAEKINGSYLTGCSGLHWSRRTLLKS